MRRHGAEWKMIRKDVWGPAAVSMGVHWLCVYCMYLRHTCTAIWMSSYARSYVLCT